MFSLWLFSDLKGSTSLSPSKRRKNGKENMFDSGVEHETGKGVSAPVNQSDLPLTDCYPDPPPSTPSAPRFNGSQWVGSVACSRCPFFYEEGTGGRSLVCRALR